MHWFKNRPIQLIALLVGAAAALTGCTHHGESAAEKSELRVGFVGTVGGAPSGPEGWAYKQGLLLPALHSAA